MVRNHAEIYLDTQKKKKNPKFKCRVHWRRLYIITLLPHYSHRPVQWNSPKNTAKPGANWTPQPMAATTGAGYRPMVSFAYSNSSVYRTTLLRNNEYYSKESTLPRICSNLKID